MCRRSQQNDAHEFVLVSPIVLCMSCLCQWNILQSKQISLGRIYHQTLQYSNSVNKNEITWMYLRGVIIFVGQHIHLYRCTGIIVNIRQWSGRSGFNPRSSHTKDLKNGTWCRLNIQKYPVRIKDKWSLPRKGVAPPLHLGVIATEKGAFGCPRQRSAN